MSLPPFSNASLTQTRGPRVLRFPRTPVFLVIVLLASGCEAEPSVLGWIGAPAPPPPAPQTSAEFDPNKCGRIQGRITWPGPLPHREEFHYGIPKGDGNFDMQIMSSPNHPEIAEGTRAVAGAVVFLRKVNLTATRPWGLPPVQIEMTDRQIRIRQGAGELSRVGFVRRDAPVTMVVAEKGAFHVLRGRGVAYFSYHFPGPDQSLTRTFDRPGRIELSSGAGYYWASADLFVDDHSYYTRTDRDGRFMLDQVPAGPVEVVAWLPGWEPRQPERDPESTLVIRMSYSPPVEVVRSVTVSPKGVVELDVMVP